MSERVRVKIRLPRVITSVEGYGLRVVGFRLDPDNRLRTNPKEVSLKFKQDGLKELVRYVLGRREQALKIYDGKDWKSVTGDLPVFGFEIEVLLEVVSMPDSSL